nr:copia protein [Tanacetum cinerariifolium]
IVQICLWIINSGCKHMTGNRALLTNFVEKFLGTVRFSNNDFAVIAGYGDVVIGSMMIKKVYYIIDSGCSKHMTGNRALLTNFVEKFLETVRFGNNDFAVIDGYGDVVIGSMTIKKVYYLERLGHNLFSVGQFCDKGLEVAFRKSTCFVRNDDGVDLHTGDRSSNLYTITLNEVASNSSTCLLAKASSLKSWLWHQCLSHLNFATINNLVKNNLVQGLPKMKFKKDHLCSACEQWKIHRKHHKSKMAFASNKPLYLLHVDLCGLMRVQSINGKQYMVTWGGRVRDWYYSSGCRCTVHCPGDDRVYRAKGREKELWFVRVWVWAGLSLGVLGLLQLF